MRHLIIFVLSFVLTNAFAASKAVKLADDFSQSISLKEFIDEMVSEHGFDKKELDELFKHAKLQRTILEAIARPAEGKEWHEYRPIFLTQSRIDGGVVFWNDNKAPLTKARKIYGVNEEVIVAIIGVESRYGKHTGRYTVLDALSTLAFAYPPRSKFFTSELKHFLLMSREEKMDPLELKGSYAGAMGYPQFIPSSYRSYAIDFDGDGTRDLWTNTTDIIGSVANYFKRHGWVEGQPIAHKVDVTGIKYKTLFSNKMKPKFTVEEMRLAGVIFPDDVPGNLKGSLVELQGADGPEYWAIWQNFYVISRYNHSVLYSLAVFQLSNKIKDAK